MIKPVKFKVGRGNQEDLPTKYIDGFIWFATDTGKLYIDAPINGTLERTLVNPDLDWNQIKNRPENLTSIYYNTVEGWNAQRDLIGKKDALYVYTNAREEDGKNIPNFKVGDGSSYLIDAPFITETVMKDLTDHINDTTVHISQADRIRWDNKVRAYHSTVDEENLVFTTN